MNFEVIKNEAIEVLKNIPSRPFLCLPMSAVFYAMLKDNQGIECELVTGNLFFKNECIFKQGFSITAVENEKFQEWEGHAWVEIENYICDLSFFRSLYSDRFNKPCKSELINVFGLGRGVLIAPSSDMLRFGLRYHRIETLSDNTATGIIQGMKYLI